MRCWCVSSCSTAVLLCTTVRRNGRQAGQSKQNATRCMDGDTICKQKQGSCVYCCCCFFAGVYSEHSDFAGWLAARFAAAGRRTGYTIASLALTHFI